MALRPQYGDLYGLALCAGIGGLELGLKMALGGRYRSVCMVEREVFNAAVLAERMHDGLLDQAAIWDDLATFDGRPWRSKVDIVSAGFPCQPVSAAGRRKGTDDSRWLWPHVARIIREVRPKLAFFENVPGLVTLGLQGICQDLQTMGYGISAGVFSAAEVGAPHVRKRLFFLAYADNELRGSKCAKGVEMGRFINGLHADGAENDGGSAERCQACRIESWDDSQATQPAMVRTFDGLSRGLDQNYWQEGWDARVEKMTSERHMRLRRLKALGNGVVPQVAAKAFATLLRFIKDTYHPCA